MTVENHIDAVVFKQLGNCAHLVVDDSRVA
jgi:hypothetical protein